jgi:hypothetical protein
MTITKSEANLGEVDYFALQERAYLWDDVVSKALGNFESKETHELTSPQAALRNAAVLLQDITQREYAVKERSSFKDEEGNVYMRVIVIPDEQPPYALVGETGEVPDTTVWEVALGLDKLVFWPHVSDGTSVISAVELDNKQVKVTTEVRASASFTI